MTKQVNLDACSTEYMSDLLRQGSEMVNRTNVPLILYRITTDESENCYEETVCTLAREHVIEQSLTYGGPVPLSIGEQTVYAIADYPAILMAKSTDLFERTLLQIRDELEQAS